MASSILFSGTIGSWLFEVSRLPLSLLLSLQFRAGFVQADFRILGSLVAARE